MSLSNLTEAPGAVGFQFICRSRVRDGNGLFQKLIGDHHLPIRLDPYFHVKSSPVFRDHLSIVVSAPSHWLPDIHFFEISDLDWIDLSWWHTMRGSYRSFETMYKLPNSGADVSDKPICRRTQSHRS